MTADGKLFGFGRNQNGQLGLGSTADRLHPTLIEPLQVGNKLVGQSSVLLAIRLS